MIPVDLFGQPADYDRITSIAEAEGLFVLADAAQAFGASYRNNRLGTLAPATATSFFPSKPLGCYGDGGAVLTDDESLAQAVRSLRVHGEGCDSDESVRIGINSRFDTIQAAVLIEKLKIFPEEIVARERAARRYCAGLADVVNVPKLAQRATSVWAAVYHPAGARPAGRIRRRTGGARHSDRSLLPDPAASPGALSPLSVAEGGAPVSERLAAEVISLPIHAYLGEETQSRIIAAVRRALVP